ncbi:MAG TPA: sigma-54 dependent transcriptional regulator [Thermoanaerobaculia bacterium]|jgi:DNA-binding NtrC family response regulator|nr:sigma-54 dependent transcriptional regulator [Thermoanaerobaculia bacterium]
MAGETILIVDDEPAVRFGIRDYLENRGYLVREAESCREAQEVLAGGEIDAAVVDYVLPDGNALDLLSGESGLRPPIIILTAHGSIELAVQAIKEGAEQFLTKPVALPAIAVMLERALENRRSRKRELFHRSRRSRCALDPFLGTSPGIRRLAREAQRVCRSERPILIRGETGTGKGVLARWLHDNSPRAEEPFVDINCAGLSREFLETELFGHRKGAFTGAVEAKLGLFEVADRGTLFLDELGDMDLQVQAKLLKVIEEKRFRRLGDVSERSIDVRLVAATHQDLGSLITERRFRGDLYFRISTLPLTVPPLRERREDIPALASRLLADLANEVGRRRATLSPDALQALQDYDWPGNIRELSNVLERAVLLAAGETLLIDDLRFEGTRPSRDLDDSACLTLEELELRHVVRVLKEEGGHVGRAAARLGVPRSTLYQKIKRYGITATDEGG